MVWLKFAFCLAVILFAGTKLARYGDVLAEKTGLGRIWIGLMFLGAITSMPELVTGVSSAALVSSPDMALGTLLGSCCFNLSILALLDILHRRTPILTEASTRHIALAGWGILLVAIAAGGMVVGRVVSPFAVGWVGIPSIIIFVSYMLAMRQIFRSERSQQTSSLQADVSMYGNISTKEVCLKFALAAMAVIAAGIWLAFIGDEIGEVTGWNASFVGSLLLAVTTSAPELVVTITALRMDAVDLAVADVLGANMLDVMFIAPVDLFYTQGSVLSVVSSSHLVTAAVVVVMNITVIAGLRLRRHGKTFGFASWYVPVLIGLFIFAAYVLFSSGAGAG